MTRLRRYRTLHTVSAQLLQATSVDIVDLLRQQHTDRVHSEGHRIVETDDPERTPVWFMETDEGLAESRLPQDRDPDAYCYAITSTVEEAR